MLDCFFTNRAGLFDLTRLPKIAASDHYVILANPTLSQNLYNSIRKIKLRDLRSNWRDFGAWITTMNWSPLYLALSCFDKLAFLTKILTSAMDIYFPSRTVKIHIQDKPWIIAKLKYYISKRQQAFLKSGKDSIVYKFWCNKVRFAVQLAKRHYTAHTKCRIWHNQILLNGGSKLNNSLVKFLTKAMSGFTDLLTLINFMSA